MYKQSPKSPAMKALVGNQPNLPEALQAAIKAAPAKKTIGPEGSKKTQRIRAKVQKNEDKLFTTEVNSKKEDRLYKKDARLRNKLTKSKEKDKVKSVAKNYKKGYYGV